MKKFVLFLPLAAVVACGTPAAGDDASGEGFFPPSHELFKPLQADPRELHYALRGIISPGHRRLGEAAIGDYLGVYRCDLPGEDAYFQMSVGGGVFGRFDLSGNTNALQVADFYANMPFDWRFKKWSFRFMPYHTSSHLGDDYLKVRGLTTDKHAWDNLRWLASYDWTERVRLYGGYTYIFRTLPKDDRHALQAGFETASAWWENGHVQAYWANDIQCWERIRWNPMFSSQAGIHLVKTPPGPRGVSLFVEFVTGHQPQGQFYQNTETRWGLGIKFHLS